MSDKSAPENSVPPINFSNDAEPSDLITADVPHPAFSGGGESPAADTDKAPAKDDEGGGESVEDDNNPPDEDEGEGKGKGDDDSDVESVLDIIKNPKDAEPSKKSKRSVEDDYDEDNDIIPEEPEVVEDLDTESLTDDVDKLKELLVKERQSVQKAQTAYRKFTGAMGVPSKYKFGGDIHNEDKALYRQLGIAGKMNQTQLDGFIPKFNELISGLAETADTIPNDPKAEAATLQKHFGKGWGDKAESVAKFWQGVMAKNDDVKKHAAPLLKTADGMIALASIQKVIENTAPPMADRVGGGVNSGDLLPNMDAVYRFINKHGEGYASNERAKRIVHESVLAINAAQNG